MQQTYDFLIIGGGIFGICTSIELQRQQHKVGLINPGKIPHPFAASTDISKIVRMEYGSDTEYMDMAMLSIELWRNWNILLGQTVFHETGFLLSSPFKMERQPDSFETTSYINLLRNGFQPERLDRATFRQRFPAFQALRHVDGFYHHHGGYAESGRAVELLANYARNQGVEIIEGQTAKTLAPDKGKIATVHTQEGRKFSAGEVIVCAGNSTPYLLPELQAYFRVTGHPVFHLQPSRPELFKTANFSVFAADISNTGWYGFPMHPKEQVIKIAKHGPGLLFHPEKDERVVSKKDIAALRIFLKNYLPVLAKDPIVYTRLCCYTDTLDGHFWIDRHPSIKNLSVGSGGSGHGFKMGPLAGEMIAAVAQGDSHLWSDRFRWRHLEAGTLQQEEARAKK